MSGHSKWHTIKHKKGALDAKRGKVFTKLIKEIQVAARMGGGDPDANARLRKAVSDAKGANMPNDTIDARHPARHRRGEGVSYDEITYEGYGPGGVAVMVDSMTDNRNRTVAEIRHIFSKNGGNLGTSGAVGWMFEKKGYIVVAKEAKSEDELFEIVTDAGADDLRDDGDNFEIITSPEDFDAVLDAVKKRRHRAAGGGSRDCAARNTRSSKASRRARCSSSWRRSKTTTTCRTSPPTSTWTRPTWLPRKP